MLRYRLIFGTLMALFFTGVVILDGWFDGSIAPAAADKPIQATGLCILIALLAIPAQMEISSLAGRLNMRIFKPLAVTGSILLATSWYWPQFYGPGRLEFHLLYVLFVSVFCLVSVFVYQAVSFGIKGVFANCAANYFSIFYLGLLSSFVPGIRIEFGLWPLLMFIFVIKSSDIGAYAIGRAFGKHKFCPGISPGKTWEGLGGAVMAAIVVAILFARGFNILRPMEAALFGAVFAFVGQFGDLAESMLKRDAQQKDSSDTVPGFGGILDIIDSPLISAPFAYLFFMVSISQ